MGVGQRRTQTQAQFQTGGRKAENSCPAVIRMHLAIKQLAFFQGVHDVPGGHSVDTQPLCEPPLVQTGLVVKSGKHRELEGGEILLLSYFCQDTKAYLVKSSRKMCRYAMNGRDFCVARAGYRNAATCLPGLPATRCKFGHGSIITILTVRIFTNSSKVKSVEREPLLVFAWVVS